MGAQQNIPMAGDAARRMARSGRMLFPGRNPRVMGEMNATSPNAVRLQELFADRPGLVSALETQNPSFSQGITTDPDFLGRMSDGAPGYEQIKQRLRGLRDLRNTGSSF